MLVKRPYERPLREPEVQRGERPWQPTRERLPLNLHLSAAQPVNFRVFHMNSPVGDRMDRPHPVKIAAGITPFPESLLPQTHRLHCVGHVDIEEVSHAV